MKAFNFQSYSFFLAIPSLLLLFSTQALANGTITQPPPSTPFTSLVETATPFEYINVRQNMHSNGLYHQNGIEVQVHTWWGN